MSRDTARAPRGVTWSIVGVFDSGGSAFDSEIWCDADLLNQAYQRPRGIAQSVAVRLVSPGALEEFKRRLTSDPRMTAHVESEVEY